MNRPLISAVLHNTALERAVGLFLSQWLLWNGWNLVRLALIIE